MACVGWLCLGIWLTTLYYEVCAWYDKNEWIFFKIAGPDGKTNSLFGNFCSALSQKDDESRSFVWNFMAIIAFIALGLFLVWNG